MCNTICFRDTSDVYSCGKCTTMSALREDIQGLRGIAVLLVVLFHAGVPGIVGGFIGVDVFFVISGYLITGLLTADIARSGRINLLSFFARRAKRLLPAALAMLVCVVAASTWLYPPVERLEWLSAARATALYLSNFWLAGRASDYFAAETHGNPLLHTWSLAVEEQFYLAWPLLLLLFLRWAPVNHERQRRWLAKAVLLLSLVSLCACILLTDLAQPWAFFGMPLRAWEFGLGAIIVFASLDKCQGLARLGPAWAGVLILAATVLYLRDDVAFPGALALLPAGATALMIVGIGGPGPSTGLSRLLSVRPLAYLGDISYSWYLWHWPLLVWVDVLFPGGANWHKVPAIALSLVLAAASYRWVENPIRRAKLDGWQSRQVVLLALASSAGIAILIWGLMLWAPSKSTGGTFAVFDRAVGDRPKIYRAGCHLFFFDSKPTTCAYGSVNATPTIVLIGDSHAAQWFPALEAMANHRHWRLIPMTKAACPALDMPVRNETLRRRYSECEVWRKSAIQYIERVRPELVVMASASTYHADPEIRSKALTSLISEIGSSARQVVVIRDTPTPGFNVPVCLARAAWRGQDSQQSCAFSRGKSETDTVWHEAQSKAERSAVANFAQARYLDLSDALCPTDQCKVFDGKTVMFSDAHHLSASFVASLSTLFERAVETSFAINHPPTPDSKAPSSLVNSKIN